LRVAAVAAASHVSVGSSTVSGSACLGVSSVLGAATVAEAAGWRSGCGHAVAGAGAGADGARAVSSRSIGVGLSGEILLLHSTASGVHRAELGNESWVGVNLRATGTGEVECLIVAHTAEAIRSVLHEVRDDHHGGAGYSVAAVHEDLTTAADGLVHEGNTLGNIRADSDVIAVLDLEVLGTDVGLLVLTVGNGAVVSNVKDVGDSQRLKLLDAHGIVVRAQVQTGEDLAGSERSAVAHHATVHGVLATHGRVACLLHRLLRINI